MLNSTAFYVLILICMTKLIISVLQVEYFFNLLDTSLPLLSSPQSPSLSESPLHGVSFISSRKQMWTADRSVKHKHCVHEDTPL